MLPTTLILSAISNAVLRSESSSQGYRLTAASLPCPRCSFGTSNKGAEPTLCADGRFMRSQDDRRYLNSHESGQAQKPLASLVKGRGTAVGPAGRRWWKDSLMGTEYLTCTYRSKERSRLHPCSILLGGPIPVCARSKANFCYAHTLCDIQRRATVGILQSGLPPVGGIPASPL